ncbi:MAG: hypothetical protein KDD60_10255, partial [Bdellovibrionales bacterium]|nr:hypothetical protein [Bdellovibrionales bacterium]
MKFIRFKADQFFEGLCALAETGTGKVAMALLFNLLLFYWIILSPIIGWTACLIAAGGILIGYVTGRETWRDQKEEKNRFLIR